MNVTSDLFLLRSDCWGSPASGRGRDERGSRHLDGDLSIFSPTLISKQQKHESQPSGKIVVKDHCVL